MLWPCCVVSALERGEPVCRVSRDLLRIRLKKWFAPESYASFSTDHPWAGGPAAIGWPVMMLMVDERIAPDIVATPIDRDETQVMFFRSADDPAEFGPLWERLEALVGLRGRKFFAAFYPSIEEYRVCVQIREDDDPDALGLESGTLPGGRYLRARLRGQPPEVYERIEPTFQA